MSSSRHSSSAAGAFVTLKSALFGSTEKPQRPRVWSRRPSLAAAAICANGAGGGVRVTYAAMGSRAEYATKSALEALGVMGNTEAATEAATCGVSRAVVSRVSASNAFGAASTSTSLSSTRGASSALSTSETGWPSEGGMVNTVGLTIARRAPFTGDAGVSSVANHDGEKSPKRSPDTPGDAPPPVLSTSDAVKRNTDWLFAVLVKHMVLEQSPVEVLSSASRASWCVGKLPKGFEEEQREKSCPFPPIFVFLGIIFMGIVVSSDRDCGVIFVFLGILFLGIVVSSDSDCGVIFVCLGIVFLGTAPTATAETNDASFPKRKDTRQTRTRRVFGASKKFRRSAPSKRKGKESKYRVEGTGKVSQISVYQKIDVSHTTHSKLLYAHTSTAASTAKSTAHTTYTSARSDEPLASS